MVSRKASSGLSWLSATSAKSLPALAGAKRCRAAPQSLDPATPIDSSTQTRRVNSDRRMGSDHRRPAGTIASRRGSATGGADSPQEGPARQVGSGDEVHSLLPVSCTGAGRGRAMVKASLCTTPSMNADMRYPSASAVRAISRIAGPS